MQPVNDRRQIKPGSDALIPLDYAEQLIEDGEIVGYVKILDAPKHDMVYLRSREQVREHLARNTYTNKRLVKVYNDYGALYLGHLNWETMQHEANLREARP